MRLRAAPEDFCVDEVPLYSPTGEGEHTFVRIEKRLRTTEEVARALARAAGLSVERGVVVDAQLRTSHPDVYAAGDVAQHPDGRVTHLWRHALHQGRVAGLNAAGGAED